MKKIIFAIVFILAPFVTFAHGLVTTIPMRSGNYLIEFEYNTFGNIQAGDITTFDVYLLDKDNQPVDFDGAYINISKANSEPVLVANLQEAPDIRGSSKISGVIKDGGEYTSVVHFNKNGQVIADANFNFTVDPDQALGSTTSDKKMLYLVGVAAAILGFIVGLILKRK